MCQLIFKSSNTTHFMYIFLFPVLNKKIKQNNFANTIHNKYNYPTFLICLLPKVRIHVFSDIECIENK